jgi:hypothetical protein
VREIRGLARHLQHRAAPRQPRSGAAADLPPEARRPRGV